MVSYGVNYKNERTKNFNVTFIDKHFTYNKHYFIIQK